MVRSGTGLLRGPLEPRPAETAGFLGPRVCSYSQGTAHAWAPGCHCHSVSTERCVWGTSSIYNGGTRWPGRPRGRGSRAWLPQSLSPKGSFHLAIVTSQPPGRLPLHPHGNQVTAFPPCFIVVPNFSHHTAPPLNPLLHLILYCKGASRAYSASFPQSIFPYVVKSLSPWYMHPTRKPCFPHAAFKPNQRASLV